jgi:hypothetical protein
MENILMATELKDFRRGDSFKLRFDFGDGTNITGWNITFTLRDTFTSDIVCSVKRTVGDYSLDEPLNGKFYFYFDPETSKTLIPKSYKWDIQLVIPGTFKDVLTLLPSEEYYNEPIKVLPDVTWIDS